MQVGGLPRPLEDGLGLFLEAADLTRDHVQLTADHRPQHAVRVLNFPSNIDEIEARSQPGYRVGHRPVGYDDGAFRRRDFGIVGVAHRARLGRLEATGART